MTGTAGERQAGPLHATRAHCLLSDVRPLRIFKESGTLMEKKRLEADRLGRMLWQWSRQQMTWSELGSGEEKGITLVPEAAESARSEDGKHPG